MPEGMLLQGARHSDSAGWNGSAVGGRSPNPVGQAEEGKLVCETP